MAEASIREAGPDDAGAIVAIYNHYVRESIATFEETPVKAAVLSARIGEARGARLPWLVADSPAGVAGYAYASQWKGRCAYRYAVETTVYVAAREQGRGIGTLLYAALLERLRAAGMHVAIGGIALPNAASMALHERLGFVKVAHFPEVGCKFGRWVDVGYWQIAL